MGKKRKRESLSEDENADLSMEGREQINSEEYFFDVRKDLKELFNSAGSEFSFIGGKPAEESRECGPEEPLGELKPDKKKRLVEPKVGEITAKYFFFHTDSATLRNRLDDNNFVRTEPFEQLEEEWPDRRTSMKSSFRKRYKEVMKAKKRKHWTQRSDV